MTHTIQGPSPSGTVWPITHGREMTDRLIQVLASSYCTQHFQLLLSLLHGIRQLWGCISKLVRINSTVADFL